MRTPVSVPRHTRFAGTVRPAGERIFDKLVGDGFAIRRVSSQSRACITHHRPLYRAIGEPDSRLAARSGCCVMERLMLLDGVLDAPSLRDLARIRRRKGSSLPPSCPRSHVNACRT
jgi:hypothetical protein